MASESDSYSDGSDLEIDYSSDEENLDDLLGKNVLEVRQGEIDDDWIGNFFFNDDNDDKFEGFDHEWRTENFTPRNMRAYNDVGGSVFQHPEEAMPHHYFNLIWGDDLWRHIVTETNRLVSEIAC